MTTKIDENDPLFRTSMRQWRMWHQKLPRKVRKRKFNWPDSLRPIGTADEILYISDKWEEDGDFHPYSHDFESHPVVYLGVRNRKGSVHEPGVKSAEDILRLEGKLTGRNALPDLANVQELSYDSDEGGVRGSGSGGRMVIKFRGHPTMSCSPDKKTVIILDGTTFIAIRGGSMVVTERGIVN